MQKISFFLFAIIALASCNNPKSQKQVAKVTHLISTLDSCETVYNQLDAATIKELKQLSGEQLDFLKENFHDTNFQKAKYIGVYYDNWRLMRKYLKKYEELTPEFTYTKTQLSTLNTDAKNNLIADSTFSTYFEAEKRAVTNIEAITGSLVEWEEKAINRYNGMHHPIDSVITELNKQGYR